MKHIFLHLTLNQDGSSQVLSLSLKTVLGNEEYLKLRNCHQYSTLAKVRSGTATIVIELGRNNDVPYHDRICTLCDLNNIEDELHVLLQCNFYEDIREDLADHCEQTEYNF